MTRLSIAGLPVPSAEYRIDLLDHESCGGFETENDARKEDQYRSKLLIRAAALANNPENRNAATFLAQALDYGDGGPPPTLASSLYMRDHRIRVTGAGLRLLDEYNDLEAATIHLIPENLEIPGSKLLQFNPVRACNRLRSTLDRIGVSQAPGAFFAYLDGEYEPHSDVFRLHFHGLALGAKVGALETLRKVRPFQSKRYRLEPGRSVQRVRFLRKLDNLPSHLAYLVKSFWPSRWEGIVDGKQVRQSYRSRISEPRHSQLLLWFNRWRLQDLSLLIGLKVGTTGLRLTSENGPMNRR